eukprot:332107-Pleurochrysis_carterae.AAC.1
MRCQLGYHFNFTRSESDDTGRYCSTRIDRHYLPQSINHMWGSEITDLLIVNSDHWAIKSTLRSTIPGSDVLCDHDLITINSRILEEETYRSKIEKSIKEHVNNIVDTNIQKIIVSIKYKVRKLMLTMTKEYTSTIEVAIKNIDNRINILHETQRRKPRTDYEQRKTALFEKKQEEFIKLSAPTQSLSHNRTLSVVDWANQPTKNTLTPNPTQEVAKEASEYYEHLYSPQQETNPTRTAKQRLLKKLREWGVEKTTSQLAGEDISTDEINKIMTFLPKGKAPGPDRVPNEFYSAYADLIAPLYPKVYNQMHTKSRVPTGFADGLISILNKKGIKEDVRNYRPITFLNSDYKMLTRTLAHRSRALATQFVSNDQKGFVPNTYIAKSTMLINMI